MRLCSVFFFFFQAEDGIRDLTVTGVQTCALPISIRTMATSALCQRVIRPEWFDRDRPGWHFAPISDEGLQGTCWRHTTSTQNPLDQADSGSRWYATNRFLGDQIGRAHV